MLYVVIALKPEAQAFVDKYKLSKSKLENFTIFTDENIVIIISGIGNQNAKLATSLIIKNTKFNNNDTLLNIGICATDTKYKIGELIEISLVNYNNEMYILNNNTKNTITCSDKEVSKTIHSIVDMESFGFYEASKEIKNCFMYKIVSDHFEPKNITKEGTKQLIFNSIDEIIKRVKT